MWTYCSVQPHSLTVEPAMAAAGPALSGRWSWVLCPSVHCMGKLGSARSSAQRCSRDLAGGALVRSCLKDPKAA